MAGGGAVTLASMLISLAIVAAVHAGLGWSSATASR
jgi:hypothetical protein